jgi:ABC-type antimicrobial peptide transport system permease subunit
MSLRAVSAQHRFPFQAAAGVSAILGILALALTAVGLYTVSSYSVLQRRREIGIHLALGATGAQVMRRILGEAWRCTLWGVVVGMPVCLVLSKLATSAILQIQTFDLITYTGVPAMLVVIAILACALPARKAARLDPMLSLREE